MAVDSITTTTILSKNDNFSYHSTHLNIRSHLHACVLVSEPCGTSIRATLSPPRNRYKVMISLKGRLHNSWKLLKKLLKKLTTRQVSVLIRFTTSPSVAPAKLLPLNRRDLP
ncbi:Notoamide biosynthesis cluster protein O' [Dissostichus eleginoides]|uniref:Notoamide biosynthesis cluster protein O n=1 Tax=Dissostichus eleginoides TaxID=100907 RepID=A0AAD9BIW4_DISEL|nr:Notoamide biosynthesis cluster protein O' [Dissostichus eleginoides]